MSYTFLPDDHHARMDLAVLSLEAQLLHYLSLTATASTEGFLTPAEVRGLGRVRDLADPLAAAAELVEEALWTAVDGGYLLVGDDNYHRPKGGRPPSSDPPPTAAAAKAREYRARHHERVTQPPPAGNETVAQPLTQPPRSELHETVAQPHETVAQPLARARANRPPVLPTNQPSKAATASDQDEGYRAEVQPPMRNPALDILRVETYALAHGWDFGPKPRQQVTNLLNATPGLTGQHFVDEWEEEMTRSAVVNPWAVAMGPAAGIKGNAPRVVRRMIRDSERRRELEEAEAKAIRDRQVADQLAAASNRMAPPA